MTLPTHLIAGAVVGHLTGDYGIALVTSVVIDLDHIPSMLTKGSFRHRKIFFKSLTKVNVPEEAERGIFHNIWALTLLSLGAYLYFPAIWLPFCIAYFVHLLLDFIDNARYSIFYPFSSFTFRGPIKYFSSHEVVFASILLIAYVLMILL